MRILHRCVIAIDIEDKQAFFGDFGVLVICFCSGCQFCSSGVTTCLVHHIKTISNIVENRVYLRLNNLL